MVKKVLTPCCETQIPADSAQGGEEMLKVLGRWMLTALEKPALPMVEARHVKMKSRPAAVAYLGATPP
jgi:hypothetical protein